MGRGDRGDRLSAASRRVVAQRVVPAGRHRGGGDCDCRDDRLLSPGPRRVSAGRGDLGRRLRAGGQLVAQLCRLCRGLGRLYGGDHCQRPARRDRRFERPSLHLCGEPGQRNLHRHRLRGPGPRRDRSWRRPPPGGGPVRRTFGGDFRRLCPHACDRRRRIRKNADAAARAHASGHRARPGHRRGDRRILGASLPLAALAERFGWSGTRSLQLADGGGGAGVLAAASGPPGGRRPVGGGARGLWRDPRSGAGGAPAGRTGAPVSASGGGDGGIGRSAGANAVAAASRRPGCRRVGRDGQSADRAGLARLRSDPAGVRDRGRRRLRIPDWLPPLANAGRALVVIVAAELFWIVTAWPGGANTVTFAAIIVILFAARADQAYQISIGFIIGSILTVGVVAALLFAVLPNVETFAGFALRIGFVLVPIGTALALQWQPAVFTGMVTVFVPLLAPANPMSYDQQQYYNTALTIVAGAGAAALSFRLLPPLSPAYRARRLLALALRDLRRLATGRPPDTSEDWEQRMYARFALLPDQALPIQRSWLTAAFSAGVKIIRLRHLCRGLRLSPALDPALQAFARGDCTTARAKLGELDAVLIARPEEAALRARGLILAISAALTQHAAFFAAGAPG